MEYPITEEQVRFYERNGFLQIHNVLAPDELGAIRDSLEEAARQRFDPTFDREGISADYDRVFVQKVNLWRVHEGVRRYVFSPKLARIARALTRSPRVRLWHDHALIKMPGDSKPSAWHQDLPYWPMNESTALSCWMALDDVDENNGCMQFVPGSHLWGRFEPIRLTDPQDLFALVPDGQSRDFTPAKMPMRAGSCTFHNGLTFHYAGPNRTDKPRRAMVTIYMPEGTTYRPQPHIVTDGLNLEEGSPLTGEMFPVLSEAPTACKR
ncbi:MAG: phytanoyl-CoA dioxygenase family protein [Armatimonadetes bacterium]|nr:phytanoyl-CoA dioxygenase family protein [Armatimonadota bacterium]